MSDQKEENFEVWEEKLVIRGKKNNNNCATQVVPLFVYLM